METSGSIECWGRMRQSARLILTAITIIAWSTFDQVLAAPVERIFPPHELLDHRESGGGIIQLITLRSNAALHSDTVNSTNSASGRDEHALGPDLASAQGSEVQKLLLRTDGLPSAIVKGNAVDLHKQMAASRTTHVLDRDGHWKGVAILDYILPLIDQGDTNNYATRPHAFFEIFGEYAQVIDRNFIGSGSNDIGFSSALVGLAGGFQAFIRDTVGFARYIDTDLGKPDTVNGSLQPFARLIKAYQKADRADQGEQKLRPGEKCYLPGPLGCSPLSAKIGATLVCGLIAWSLIFRIFDLLDRRRRNWRLILPLGGIAGTLYLLPGYLVVGFPWNW